ncbi:MAG: 16S rRNA (guanine(527)-N(7))-methyltransferase RsmG [Oscillospiraceae bacterium]|nr:16S rRNA (guanine(527)-N(7))-methyltransferase RsmG [Oscillospiraceae bacterium]
MREVLAHGLKEMGLSPTEEQIGQLEQYAGLLIEQNKVMNLTAITEPEQMARLHFMDSAAILAWPKVDLAGKSVIDVGTGAGFPGMVLKILEPSISLTLVDSLGKRVAWLETVCEALSLDGVRCLHARAEELALEKGFRDSFDVAVSRAVASYPLLCELCLPFVRPGGVFLSMKSVESGAEVKAGENAVKQLGAKALGHWDYAIPGAGVTHRLVGTEKISPTPKGLPRSWGKIKKSPL